ncbi:YgiW/YdeI family stress tolerance OB fold protein [Burkholderia guangdongensis]|uniref:YgiW/YdeI family stress tolerance OB fold protein n=1 Tax=Burkholderia guangdongensis TaxID=1792500 RepID=UPI0015CBA1D5|nr:NirD/YgiW/YdeI family stress tolerance protein [Burkholderia guangdongensis]
MKKTIIALALTIAALPALAQYTGPGADAAAQPTTVKQLLASGKDDQQVVLRGHITKQLDDDKYQFSDGTGEIPVKIKHWPNGQTIGEKNTVELSGEYDKPMFESSKLKVKQIKVVQ